MSAPVAVANAPCSYGVFDEEYGSAPNVPGPEEVLDDVRTAEYDGIDLGPLPFLGEGPLLEERLRHRGLALAGAYVEIPLADADAFDAVLPRLDRALDALTVGAGEVPPRPTLADAGSARRAAHVGRAAIDPAFGWTDGEWDVVADNVARLVAHCRGRGFEPTFHPHAGTYVEAEREIDRLLELTEIGLCFDTGHLMVGGADVMRGIAAWSERINHVHLKDVRTDVLAGILADQPPLMAVWRRGAFCALGSGEAPNAAVVQALAERGYRGWLVVEQDVLPHDPVALADAIRAQPANRRHLRALGV